MVRSGLGLFLLIVEILNKLWGCGVAWLTHCPVKAEIAGSNPVIPAYSEKIPFVRKNNLDILWNFNLCKNNGNCGKYY